MGRRITCFGSVRPPSPQATGGTGNSFPDDSSEGRRWAALSEFIAVKGKPRHGAELDLDELYAAGAATSTRMCVSTGVHTRAKLGPLCNRAHAPNAPQRRAAGLCYGRLLSTRERTQAGCRG